MELSLFPECARRPPATLQDLATSSAMKLILETVDQFLIESKLESTNIRRVRKYIRQHLTFHLLTDIFKRFLPEDHWSHPCAHPKYGNACKRHTVCLIVFYKLPVFIKVLFSEDIQDVHIDLRKVKQNNQSDVIQSFTSIFTKIPRREFRLLHTFVIQSAGKIIEDSIVKVEELAFQLKEMAENLQILHLPVASNIVLAHVADMKNLRVFRSDRSKNLSGRGVLKLAARESKSKYKLEVLHIGVFKHPAFWKEDVFGLVRFMENLKEFSFMDSDRMISRSPWHQKNGRGDKVLAYSVFKLAIRKHEMKDNWPWPGGRIGPELLATDIREMIVVDRVLKPHYLLESAPKLSSLIIDWQENYRPSSEMPVDWFKDMIGKASWRALAVKLKKLSITFPASYIPNAYSLPPQDFSHLMSHLSNLTHLHLKGAGMNGPFPLLPVLRQCPLLTELLLENTPIHVPNDFEAVREEYKQRNLVKFHLIDELSSLSFHQHLTSIIASYMPELEELEITVKNVREFNGFTLEQVGKLSRLKRLKRLGITFSTSDVTGNMPASIFILKEFHALENLVISWGAYDHTNGINGFYGFTPNNSCSYPAHLMTWLQTALEANNSKINLQLSMKHHAQEYLNPAIQYYNTILQY